MKKRITIFTALALSVIMVLSGCNDTKKDKDDNKSDNSKKSSVNDSADIKVKTGDNLSWPDGKMGDIEKPNGKINTVVKDESTGSYLISFSEMEKDDAKAYIEKLKKQGYSNGLDLSDANGFLFNGTKKDGSTVTFTYTFAEKEGALTYGSKEAAATTAKTDDKTPTTTVDMNDVAPWPSDLMNGIPELKGKIVNVIKKDKSIEVDFEYVNKTDFEAYVNGLKSGEFSTDADLTTDVKDVNFSGFNSKGDRVDANFYTNESGNTANVSLEKAE